MVRLVLHIGPQPATGCPCEARIESLSPSRMVNAQMSSARVTKKSTDGASALRPAMPAATAVAMTIVGIFIIEVLVMGWVSRSITSLPNWAIDLFDASLLSVLATPLIWRLVNRSWRAAAAAEASNQAKSAFLANMSHEIRTPMTSILGYADLLIQGTRSPSELLDFVQAIRRNGEHLLEIINDILDLSKVDSGKMTIERTPCSPARIAAEIESIMRVRAIEKGISLKVEFATPVPEAISSDPTRIRQILVNLVGNSVKFTHKGEVQVFLGLHEEQGRPMMRFEVRETGIGLTPEQQTLIFEPFAHADNSTTRKFGGTGLGLTISRRLAEMMGGRLTVSSALGVGSTFTLTVPTGPIEGVRMFHSPADVALDPETDAETRIVDHLHARILLAEDGLDNQQIISLNLREAGSEVTIVDNGLDAVESAMTALARGAPFDVILMDMQMPALDGYQATARLRGKGYRGAIIALTAHAMAGDRDRCMAVGCDDYLTKPIRSTRLITTIARYVPGPATSATDPVMAHPVTPRQSAATNDAPLRSTYSNNQRLAKVLTSFIDRLPGQATELLDLLRKVELDSLRRVVHQLKGAGGGYGFDVITETAARAEEGLEGGSIEQAAAEVHELVQLLRRVEGYDKAREETHATNRSDHR